MANYHTHTVINFGALIPVSYLAGTRQVDPVVAFILITGHFLGTFLLSPDLDTHSQPYKNWGWLRFIWKPYQKMIGHRSLLSHAPIVGTAIRLTYLIAWACSVLSAFLWLFPAFRTAWPTFSLESFYSGLQRLSEGELKMVVSLIVGLEAGALVHIITDHVTSLKKQFKNFF